MAQRQAFDARPGEEDMARLARAGQRPEAVRGLRRRARASLGQRLRRQRRLALRPGERKFERLGFPREAANVRQIHGRPGEIWLPESGTEFVSVIRT
jgi:streptogramin lyase